MKINIQFYSNWAIGSGKGGDSKDSIILKDDNGLPFIPGRTLKGLVRDAFIECGNSKDETIALFGQEKQVTDAKEKKDSEASKKIVASSLRFNSAYLHQDFSKLTKQQKSYLFTSKTSTRLEENKQVKEHSLRKNEICIPLELTATIFNQEDNFELSDSDYKKIEQALKMLKILGEKRHRGLGRCKITAKKYSLKAESDGNKGDENDSNIEKNSIRFKCTVTEPLILVKKAKTGQNIESLDYIPGNTFRGIVAGVIANGDPKKFNNIIFNNTVQFGDAHLLINGERSLKTPFSFFYNKSNTKDTLYNFHYLTPDDWIDKKLKSQKNGYLIPSKKGLVIKKIAYGNRVKSSRDLKRRSAEKGGLFSYHYIKQGQAFEFEVSSICKEYLKDIKTILHAKTKYFGKSKSAEFGGAIKIEYLKNTITKERIRKGNYLYAESNLCFLNQYGEFTATPTANQLGAEDNAEIDWEKSQVKFRTFTPYNFHRQNNDFERLIIEKGSVFVFKEKIEFDVEKIKNGIGCFLTEGYGKVLINTSFLDNKEVTLVTKDKKELALEHEIKSIELKPIEIIESESIKIKYNKSVTLLSIDKRVDGEFKKCYKQKTTNQWDRVFNATTNANTYAELILLLWNEGRTDGGRDESIFTGGSNTWDQTDIKLVQTFLKDSINKNHQILALRKLAKSMISKLKQ